MVPPQFPLVDVYLLVGVGIMYAIVVKFAWKRWKAKKSKQAGLGGTPPPEKKEGNGV